MTFSIVNTTFQNGGYFQDLYNILKTRENAPRTLPGAISGIHNDSVGLPTMGYGFNLAALAHTASIIEDAITYAFGGTLSALQQDGVDIILSWKNGTPITVGGLPVTLSNAQLISMAEGNYGDPSQQQALQSFSDERYRSNSFVGCGSARRG